MGSWLKGRGMEVSAQQTECVGELRLSSSEVQGGHLGLQ